MVLVAGLALSGCTPEPETFTISGTIQVTSSDLLGGKEGEPCTAEDGYDDIRAGVPILVSTDNDGTVAKGSLNAGVGTPATVNGTTYGGFYCTFAFSLDGLPDTDEFYTVKIANRGEQVYSRQELQRPLALRLG